jgi:hypothetical protein
MKKKRESCLKRFLLLETNHIFWRQRVFKKLHESLQYKIERKEI